MQKAFFVQTSKNSSKSKHKPSDDIVSDLLAIGKKAGLSFVEMNELTVSDMLDLAKSFSGVKDDKPRKATQEDIDTFFGREKS